MVQYGHFDNEKREYVIDRVDLPASLDANYLGLKGHVCRGEPYTAGGYSVLQDAGVPPASPVSGETAFPWTGRGIMYTYEDNSDGDYWSISWQPVGKSLEGKRHTAAATACLTPYMKANIKASAPARSFPYRFRIRWSCGM